MSGFNFDEPGTFVVEPVERVIPNGEPVVHQIRWIPDGWTGVVVCQLVTDIDTAAKLSDRLNSVTAEYERGYIDGYGDAQVV